MLLHKIKEIQEYIQSSKNFTFDQIKAQYPNMNEEQIRFVGEQFLIQSNYTEAEKCYRQINSFSELKFIQRLREGL